MTVTTLGLKEHRALQTMSAASDGFVRVEHFPRGVGEEARLRLVEKGLATHGFDQGGNRGFTITAAGREALSTAPVRPLARATTPLG